jgi:hypothetical protein
MSDATTEPEYLSTFCPILSHAVLSPAVLKEEKQMLIPLGPETAAAAPTRQAEYIGCQGPSCAFFLRGENKCCIPLLTQGFGILVAAQLGQLPTTPPQH